MFCIHCLLARKFVLHCLERCLYWDDIRRLIMDSSAEGKSFYNINLRRGWMWKWVRKKESATLLIFFFYNTGTDYYSKQYLKSIFLEGIFAFFVRLLRNCVKGTAWCSNTFYMLPNACYQLYLKRIWLCIGQQFVWRAKQDLPFPSSDLETISNHSYDDDLAF